MITSHAPGFELTHYILSLAARAADRPRQIDRYIDYFGGAADRSSQDDTATAVRFAR